MKKGILFRLLVIVLVCAMLFGLMGFTTIEPQDGEDGVQNEVVTEQPTGSQGEEPKGEEPGEKPSEEPGEKPGEEPQNPELIKISIASVKGGTLALDKEKLPEGAEVEEDGSAVYAAEGTVLNFVATAAKEGVVSSKFVAAYVDDETDKAGPVKVEDCTEADGGYKFSITTGKNPITVSAEFFGIKSVMVDGNDEDGKAVWTSSKTVSVETFGAASAKLGNIAMTKGDNGVFTAVVAEDIETSKDFVVTVKCYKLASDIEETVTVEKVDTQAPVITDFNCIERDITGPFGIVTWDTEYVWSFKASDEISGIKEIKIKDPKGKDASYNISEKDGVYTFTANESTAYKVVVYDKAGNFRDSGNKDIIAPEIVNIDVVPGKNVSNETELIWWAGKGATLTISAKDSSGIDRIQLNDKTAVLSTDGQATKAEFEIKQSGKYDVSIADKEKPENIKTQKLTINYDPDAPVIDSATYHSAPENDNWLKGFINNITGGYLFNESFDIKFVANDGKDNAEKGTMASGIASADYILVPGKDTFTQEDIDNGTWNSEGVNVDQRDVVVKIAEDFRGCVVLRVKDLAGNVAYATVGFDEGAAEKTKGELITNKATVNDTSRESEDFNPYLTVMAKTTEVNENGETISVDYNGDNGDNWTQSVDFKVGFKLPENETATATVPVTTTAEDGSQVTSDQEIDVNYEYQFVSLTESHSNSADGTDSGTITDNPADEGRYLDYFIGADAADHQSFNGNVTFTLVCEKIASTSVEGADVSGLNEEVSFSTNVPVQVQNFIGSPDVSVKVVNGKEVSVANDYVSSWFNGNDNVLERVAITAPASEAPFTTTYALTYQAVNSDTSVDVEIPNAKITEAKSSTDNIKEYFTKAGVYTLTTSTEDACGNKPDSEPTITIYYDPYPATISAKFSQDKVYSANDNEYFDVLRTAEVIITDDTFTGEEDTDSFVTITKTLGAEPDYGTWRFEEADEKDGGGSWINDSISYGVKSGEAKDGDHYKMTVSVVDNAGNESRTDDMGNYYTFGSEVAESSNAYSGHKANDFTIDQTKPVVSVSFDNNNVRNGMYFNAGRTATITVKEHNFDAGRVVMTATNATAGADGKTGWVQSETDSDVWTKTVTFNPQDAICEFNIKVTDLAGNVCEEAGVNYGNSAAPNKFVIDQVNPTLGVTGTNQTPYPDACTPGFTGNDTNISSANGSAEYTVQLTRTVREHKNQDVTNLFANINPNMGADIISVVYANIPDAAENDGIYTLNVSVTDLAGNSSQTSNTFTVNRHGSFYVFNDDLAKLVNDKFVQKADGKYSITEYNASPLVAGSVKIEIYRDGQLEKTIKPTVGAAVLGASGLYEYTYDLPAENFAQDGRYSISVSSEDEAKNMSDNTKLEESILEFTVDSVNPEIVIIKGLEKAIVNAEELEFTVNAVDTYGIKSIQIVVDGEVVKTFVPQEVYDQLKAEGKAMQQYEVMDENLDFTAAYTLYESNSKQSIEIVVTDMAGNSFTTASKDFAPVYDFHDSILVSTSFFARYIHNPVALVGTGIVIAGAVWLVLAKKKKTEDAAA